ncbi:MAG TPA: tRNA lysidine(34) synthetase TilS, partial [Gemmatirosa sp.]|nr:tRNA lysidine(34) synthetase TilS [Gemmatirosa sp.]
CTVRPGLRGELLALGARAAAWRRDVAALVAALPVAARADGTVDVPVAALAAFDAPALAVVWPPLVARLGASADRRGIARLVAFTRAAAERPRGGARAQLAGGVEVRLERTADGWHLVLGRAQARHRGPDASIAREWQLEPATPSAGRSDADPWVATLPAGCAYLVRPWRPGDRLVRAAAGGAPRARRVKRYLAEARIAGDERARWPVVVAFGADGREASVVWIPGLSRGAPAPAGPDDGPAATFRCARRNGADLVPATAPVPRDAA